MRTTVDDRPRSIGRDLGGGITGLQWVVDGYTLMFAALLLSAGALSDRIGGALSVAVFGALVAHRETFVQDLQVSLVIAAVLLLVTASASLLLRPARHGAAA